MSATLVKPTREHLLELAFTEIPSKIGHFTLRPLSAGTFTLMGRLGNPMMTGKSTKENGKIDQAEMFDAVVQYIWVHSADLDQVIAIETADQLPVIELRKIAFAITIGQALAFLDRYQASTLRMTATLAEAESEDDEGGKPGKPLAHPPVGSPPSSTPAEPAEILPASATSSGSCLPSEPSATSMPPMSPTEPGAAGACLTLLPDPTQLPPPAPN